MFTSFLSLSFCNVGIPAIKCEAVLIFCNVSTGKRKPDSFPKKGFYPWQGKASSDSLSMIGPLQTLNKVYK